jgi:hypothetical protein
MYAVNRWGAWKEYRWLTGYTKKRRMIDDVRTYLKWTLEVKYSTRIRKKLREAGATTIKSKAERCMTIKSNISTPMSRINDRKKILLLLYAAPITGLRINREIIKAKPMKKYRCAKNALPAIPFKMDAKTMETMPIATESLFFGIENIFV